MSPRSQRLHDQCLATSSTQEKTPCALGFSILDLFYNDQKPKKLVHVREKVAMESVVLCLVGRMENRGVDFLPLLFSFPREGKPYFPSERLVGQIWEGGFLIFPCLVARIRR